MRFARFMQETGLAQRRELFDDAFPENRGSAIASAEHYRWKFHEGPWVPPSYEYAAIEDGRMLGYYAAIPYRYRLGDRTVSVGMVCDVMTHSQARGKGVFTDLGRFALSELQTTDLSFVTGYPIRPEVMGGHLRVGWQVAFELPMYLRPLRSDSILRSRGVGWLAPAVNLGVAAYQATRRARATDAYEIRTGSPGDLLQAAACAEFVERWSTGVRNSLVKSDEFYRWRLGAPGTSYRVFQAYRGEIISAVAIGRTVSLHGIPSFALLDLMVLPDAGEALGPLYSAVDAHARHQGVEAVVTMMSRLRAREYQLVHYGFLRSPYTFKLIVRSLEEAVPFEAISIERDWHLMWIDSDDL